MRYQFSTIVDLAAYDNEGLSDGIDLRKNNFTHLEDRGAIRAQQDWAKHVAPIKQFKGTLGHDYSFMTVCVPECIPTRLEIISYANEFAFMYDDDTELDTEDDTSAENDELMGIFLAGPESRSPSQDQSSSGKTRILKQLFSEMVAVDKECAIRAMKAWAEFLRDGSSRQHSTAFIRLEDYLPYRIKDVGEMFWFGVVTFGMALHIPDHEMDACHKLMEPAWIAVGLANDVFSWPKERDASQRLGRTHVVNAIWVVMQEHGLSQEQANQYCRKLAAQYVTQYLDNIRKIKNDESISLDLRTYVEAMQYSISGNVTWSKLCPRYNPEKCFNQTQLDWMHNGLPRPIELDSASDTSSSFLSTSTHSSPVSGSQTTIEYKDGWTADSSEIMSLFLNSSLPPLSHKVISAPVIYVDSLPSKGARDMFLDALNHWLQVDEQKVSQVKMAIRMLHNASLMLDDIQDGSRLRRGKSSAHRVFGVAQTTNSAAFLVNESIKQIRELAGDQGVAAVLEKLTSLFVGQAQDLHSSRNLSCPSLTEYIQTIDQKTSALFELAWRLMYLCSMANVVPDSSLSRFCILLGRFFQIRDDYKNLTSPEYTKQKGFCDDLNSGTYTLPLLYAISQQSENLLLQNLLSTRLAEGTLDDAQKCLALDQMQLVKTDKFLRKILAVLYDELSAELQYISSSFASKNPQMERMLAMLKL